MTKAHRHVHVNPLAYRNEADRSYGLAGMAISIASLDALDRIASISIDARGPMVQFTGEYFYGGSPNVSPKATWQRLFDNYRLTATIAIGNVLSRCAARDGGTDPSDMLEALMPTLHDEAAAVIGLEDDEFEQFIHNTLTRSHRIFSNSRLQPAISSLAQLLRQRRTLSGRSLAEELHLLRLI